MIFIPVLVKKFSSVQTVLCNTWSIGEFEIQTLGLIGSQYLPYLVLRQLQTSGIKQLR